MELRKTCSIIAIVILLNMNQVIITNADVKPNTTQYQNLSIEEKAKIKYHVDAEDFYTNWCFLSEIKRTANEKCCDDYLSLLTTIKYDKIYCNKVTENTCRVMFTIKGNKDESKSNASILINFKENSDNLVNIRLRNIDLADIDKKDSLLKGLKKFYFNNDDNFLKELNKINDELIQYEKDNQDKIQQEIKNLKNGDIKKGELKTLFSKTNEKYNIDYSYTINENKRTQNNIVINFK